MFLTKTEDKTIINTLDGGTKTSAHLLLTSFQLNWDFPSSILILAGKILIDFNFGFFKRKDVEDDDVLVIPITATFF